MSDTQDIVRKLRTYSASVVVQHEAADTIERLRSELAAAQEDARRYRWLRLAGPTLKFYVYEDEGDPCSGDWLYKPSPEAVDAFCVAAIQEGTR
jgi:hypothetical protein